MLDFIIFFLLFGSPTFLSIVVLSIVYFSFKQEQKKRVRIFNELKNKASDCLEKVAAIGERTEKELGKLLSDNNYILNKKIPKQDLSQEHEKEEIFNA